MKAMILAAGRGNRLRPLTDTLPKPLVPVLGKPLIQYHIENLKAAGINDIVINLAHLGEQIENYLGNGQAFGVNIEYSWEKEMPLEVGGGIFNALPLLGPAPFMIVNGDIWTDFPFAKLPKTLTGLAHLILVDNPSHNETGDFALTNEGKLQNHIMRPFTYSGIAVLSPALFANCQKGAFRLAPLLHEALTQDALYGEHYTGRWTDVGTLPRLQSLEKVLYEIHRAT